MDSITDITSEIIIIFTLGFLGFFGAMVLTPIYTYFAYKYHWWKQKRTQSTSGEALEVVMQQSTRKRLVPTMAGLIMVFSVTLVTVMLNFDREQTWLPLAALISGSLVGLIDDIINVRSDGTGVAGLRAPIKFAMITAVAAGGAWYFYDKLGYNSIHIPFGIDLVVGWWLIPLFIFVVVATSNAVNISDGLDGLAGGLLVSAFGAFGIIAAFQGHFGISAFCFTIVGALLAYIWFNIPPARFFMGDVGSFSLGTALGVVAMLTNALFLLPIIAFVFVIEAGSSLLQIFSKKFFGKKIFIAAPVHHHLQAVGWEKTKVTMRFWVIGQVCASVGVVLALAGGYIN